jgi:hypothetical protein
MSSSELPCLGKFPKHSFYGWWWDTKKNVYYRDCSLFGCSFSETVERLVPIGRTIFIGEPKEHAHEWDVWRGLGDQLGLIRNPPWQYKRKCRTCGVEEMVENLGREIETLAT